MSAVCRKEIVTYVKKNSKILKQEKEIIPGYGLLLIGKRVYQGYKFT